MVRRSARVAALHESSPSKKSKYEELAEEGETEESGVESEIAEPSDDDAEAEEDVESEGVPEESIQNEVTEVKEQSGDTEKEEKPEVAEGSEKPEAPEGSEKPEVPEETGKPSEESSEESSEQFSEQFSEQPQKEPKAEENGSAVPKDEPKAETEPAHLQVGDEIPDITLKDQDENEVKLRDAAKEKKVLVIFAYPKASTPGCTRQACGFRDNYEQLKEKATVFGLSADAPSAQKKFEEKQSLPFKLLSDPSRELIGLLGAKKSPSGVIRSHWIFVDGKLQISEINISPEKSVSQAKDKVEELSA